MTIERWNDDPDNMWIVGCESYPTTPLMLFSAGVSFLACVGLVVLGMKYLRRYGMEA